MSDEPVMHLLRAIRADIAELKVDVFEVRERLGFLEQSNASLSRRMDRVLDDLQQIRRRLDVVDETTHTEPA